MDIEEAKLKLRKSINYLSPLPDELIDEFLKITKIVKIKKGEQFIRAGESPKHVGFNLNGIMRLYYIDNNGNDFTKGFSTEGRFIISYSAQVEKRASFFSIEAIADTDILQFEYEKWMEIVDKDIRWYPFLYKLTQTTYIMKEKREKSFLLDDAATRYLDFKNFYPGLVEKIKLTYIASYLGIKPETLSRVRKKLELI